MAKLATELTISEVAERSGVASSALRFYETRGLVESYRTAGNQRRYPRYVLRRVAVIRAAQAVGLTLDEITQALSTLPASANPGKRDWERMSGVWRVRLDQQIADLERLRDKLSSCIGCGCLSLKNCALFNKNDSAGAAGSGGVYLHGDDTQ